MYNGGFFLKYYGQATFHLSVRFIVWGLTVIDRIWIIARGNLYQELTTVHWRHEIAYIVFLFYLNWRELGPITGNQHCTAIQKISYLKCCSLVKFHFLCLLDGPRRPDLRVTQFDRVAVLHHFYKICSSTMHLRQEKKNGFVGKWVYNFNGESTYCCRDSTTMINFAILIIARMEWVNDLHVALTYTVSRRNREIEKNMKLITDRIGGILYFIIPCMMSIEIMGVGYVCSHTLY